MKSVIRHVRRAAVLLEGDNLSDEQLLAAFVQQRDEAAFEMLLRRHGSMVLGVCRRILGNVHDSQDAFQATFLVLVYKADSIRPPGLVGPWLYRVAYRTAWKAKSMNARRRARERKAAIPVEAPADRQQNELAEVLDRELSRLPEQYRNALILCELEGRSRKDAAQLLGVPEGTLSSRLAAVPPATITATVHAAMLASEGKAAATGLVAALTKGVLMAMFLEKLRIVTGMLLVVAALGVNFGPGLYRSAADEPPAPKKVEKKTIEKKVDTVDLLPVVYMPLPTAVGLDKEGRVVVKQRWNHSELSQTPDGRKTFTITPGEIKILGTFPVEKVRFFDMQGNQLEPAAVRRKLQTERLALLFPELANAPKPDPFTLRLFKEDLLVLVIPPELARHANTSPAGAPPGAIPPPPRGAPGPLPAFAASIPRPAVPGPAPAPAPTPPAPAPKK
jgi:RNA polymerase sigma factor (sigma-70 family)